MALSSSGPTRPANAYMVSRQDQKLSSLPDCLSAMPAIARWNACECRFGMPGRTKRPRRCPSAAVASSVMTRNIPPASTSMRMFSFQPCGSQAYSAKQSVIARCSVVSPSMPRPALPAPGTNVDNTAMNPIWDGLLLDCRLATMADTDTAYGAVEHAALGWRDGVITFAGPQSGLPEKP